jgi:hypothetical protein
MALDTEIVRKQLDGIVEDLENEVESTFSSLIDPLVDVNDVLESKLIKRFLTEYGKLKMLVTEKLVERITTCTQELEGHDAEVQEAFEELVEAEEGDG